MKKRKKFLPLLLAVTMILNGCGASQTDTQSATEEETQTASESSMGRYVETLSDMSGDDEVGYYSGWSFGGASELFCYGGMYYTTADNGATWQEETQQTLADFAQRCYIIDYASAADGTMVLAGAVYSEDEETAAEYTLYTPEGEALAINVPWSGDDVYTAQLCMDENGRLFTYQMSESVIYEVDAQTGECSEYLTVNDVIDFAGAGQGMLFVAGDAGLSLYSLTDGTLLEDEVLSDFAEENCDFNQTTTWGHSAYVFFGAEENVIYIACAKGLYRHVAGGSVMEQVIDGALCTLCDPSYEIIDAKELDDQEFAIMYTGGQLAHYAYDADTPTVPANELTIYSLKESDSVQQAVLAFQKANPDVYVTYEIGMENESVTREDALKNLSTKLLAGEGPDVLVMDGLPLASYEEKGILLDLSETVAELELYDNLVTPFETDGALYVVPSEFWLPLLAGEEDIISLDENLEGLAQAFEALRERYPEGMLFSQCTPRAVMQLFMMICEPAWTDESGNVDEDAVNDFLVQTKRIYDAQMAGIGQEDVENYNKYVNYDSEHFTNLDYMHFCGSWEKIICGTLYSIDSITGTFSATRMEGLEDTQYRLLTGQSSQVYVPRNLLGINAASAHQELAISFVQLMLGEKQQQEIMYALPVNSAAMEEMLSHTPNDCDIDEDGAYLWWSVTDEEQNTIEGANYWFSEEEKEMLRGWIAQAATPYVANATLEEAVYSEGVLYFAGSQTLEESIDNIMQEVALYLQE